MEQTEQTVLFEDAAIFVSREAGLISEEAALKFFALYKQATVGDAPARPPEPGDASNQDAWGRAAQKYHAWAQMRSLSPEKAIDTYIKLARDHGFQTKERS